MIFPQRLYISFGGDKEDRTPDLMTASHALSQLSYAPELGTMISILGRPLNVNINFCFFNIFFRAPAGAGGPVQSVGSGASALVGGEGGLS